MESIDPIRRIEQEAEARHLIPQAAAALARMSPAERLAAMERLNRAAMAGGGPPVFDEAALRLAREVGRGGGEAGGG